MQEWTRVVGLLPGSVGDNESESYSLQLCKPYFTANCVSGPSKAVLGGHEKSWVILSWVSVTTVEDWDKQNVGSFCPAKSLNRVWHFTNWSWIKLLRICWDWPSEKGLARGPSAQISSLQDLIHDATRNRTRFKWSSWAPKNETRQRTDHSALLSAILESFCKTSSNLANFFWTQATNETNFGEQFIHMHARNTTKMTTKWHENSYGPPTRA